MQDNCDPWLWELSRRLLHFTLFTSCCIRIIANVYDSRYCDSISRHDSILIRPVRMKVMRLREHVTQDVLGASVCKNMTRVMSSKMVGESYEYLTEQCFYTGVREELFSRKCLALRLLYSYC